MQAIRCKFLSLVAAALAVLFIALNAYAHDVSSPGFQAAWLETQSDGRIDYHCLVDVRNCEAKRLDLVVQFRWTRNDQNICERGTGKAVMLFPESWLRPSDDTAADWRWTPQPVELPTTLWESADLEPGSHDIDAIFDLFDPATGKYVAGGWSWRATLHVEIDNRGKATATVCMPHETFPVARNVELETSPPVVANETPSPESVPKQLDAYGLKPIRVFGTTRLRHGAKVTGIAFANDGKWIVSASEEEVGQAISVWDAENGVLQQRLEGQLLLGSGGTVLILSKRQGELIVQEPGKSDPLCRIVDAPQDILAAGLSADESALLLVDAQSVGCWDVNSGRLISAQNISVEHPDDAALTASLSRCGRFVSLAYNNWKMNLVTVFEVDSGRKVLSTTIDYGVAPPVLVCEAGNRLVLPEPTRFGDRHWAVFDVASGEKLLDFKAASQGIPPSIGKDGSVLAFVDDDCLVFLDSATGQSRRISELGNDAVGVKFSPDGNSLALTGQRGTMVIATETGDILAHRTEPSSLAAFSNDGTRLLVTGSAGRMIVWDSKMNQVELDSSGLTDAVSELAVSADGTRLAAVSDSAECRVWDTATGDTLLSLRSACMAERRAAHVALSPDGSTLVTSATLGGDPLGWNIDQKRVTFVLAEGGVGGGRVAFSPNGRQIVASQHAGDESALTAWDPATGESLFHDRYLPVGMDFTLDGSELLAVDSNGIAHRYDWLQKRKIDEFEIGAPSRNMSCSPDGRVMLLNDCLHRASDGERVAQLPELGTVDAVGTFAADSRRLFVVANGRLVVYDTASGQQLKTVSGPWSITAAAISADGKRLWTGLSTGAVICWDWVE